jgi:Fic family protein
MSEKNTALTRSPLLPDREIVNRLLNGFEGKLTTSKWAKLAKCSQDTALRDIEDLIRKKVLIKDAAGGRSTSYSLAKLR